MRISVSFDKCVPTHVPATIVKMYIWSSLEDMDQQTGSK